MAGMGEIRGSEMNGLYFKFKSIRQWTLLVLLTHSRKREREGGKGRKCTEAEKSQRER